MSVVAPARGSFAIESVTDSTLIKATPGTLDLFDIVNSGIASAYFEVFDVAATADVTLGVTAPKLVFAVRASGTKMVECVNFATSAGIVVAAATARNGGTSVASGVSASGTFD